MPSITPSGPTLPATPPESVVPAPPSLECAGAVATIRLRRPAQRNRLEDEDLHTLLRHFAAVDADPSIRVLVLTADTHGQPRPVFSAGYDMGSLDGGGGPPLFARVPDALERLRPVTVCVLNGSVYGGATDLLLACDLRLGLADSEFRMPATSIGLHYYPSGLRRYVARLGLPLAQRCFLGGAAVTLGELQAAGLFVSLADGPQALQQQAEALVARVVNLAPLAAMLTKQSLLDLAEGADLPPALREREARCAASADLAEGLAAHAARRPPRFEGR